MSKNTQLGNLVNGIYVDSTGKVGVGTQSPAYLLDVYSTTAARVQIQGTTNFSALQYTNTSGSFYVGIDDSAGANFTGTAYGRFLYSAGAYPLSFVVNAVERMRITSAGKVGIGTASPTDLSGYGGLTINGTSGGYAYFNINGTDTGRLITDSTNFFFDNVSTGALVFRTTSSSTERMRITSGGNVLIGTTTDTSYKLTTNGIVAALGSVCSLLFQNRSGSNTYEWYATSSTIYVYSSSSSSNILSINGSNGTYSALSDVNKKKNFEQSNIGLNEVLQLKPTLYHLKTDDDSSPKELGFIAQEVKDLIPQAYVENENFIGLNQMPIIAALTKAIQELSAEIEILKQK